MSKKKKEKEQKIDEVEKLKTELEKMTELGKRAMADMQNMRSRLQEDRLQIIIRTNAEFIKAILPVVDNLHRALKHIPEGAEEWAKGIQMSISQLDQVFKDAGLEEIEAQDQTFNPDLHEAVIQDKGEKDKILEVLEKGYKIGNHVIRHSKVKVGNGE